MTFRTVEIGLGKNEGMPPLVLLLALYGDHEQKPRGGFPGKIG
jgi:hypothetical protein